MIPCVVCPFTTDDFKEISTHPALPIEFKEEILLENTGHLASTVYSWPFAPSDITAAYNITYSHDRTLTLEPKEVTPHSEIETNQDNNEILNNHAAR